MRTRGKKLSDRELFDLEDGELLRYIARAKAASRLQDAVGATHVLLYRHEPRMRRRVALRLPEHLAHHAETVAEWVLERVMRSALKLPLEGEHPGQWVNWWGAAIDRQVISFWRSTQGQALETERELPSEHVGEEGKRPDRLGEELDIDALVRRLSCGEIVNSVLDSMDNQSHAAIVRAAYSGDPSSAEVAERFGTTPQNVDQVKSRFRKELRAECARQGGIEP
jgi:DNA-directed RNA polymerase specialized sigma24 family protein